MEELLKVTKKQLQFQKIISAILAVMVAVLLIGGVYLMNYVGRITVAVEDAMTAMEETMTTMEDAMATIQEIDVDSINDSLQKSQDMMGSVEEFSAAVDEVTESVGEFNTWLRGLFGN